MRNFVRNTVNIRVVVSIEFSKPIFFDSGKLYTDKLVINGSENCKRLTMIAPILNAGVPGS